MDSKEKQKNNTSAVNFNCHKMSETRSAQGHMPSFVTSLIFFMLEEENDDKT